MEAWGGGGGDIGEDEVFSGPLYGGLEDGGDG